MGDKLKPIDVKQLFTNNKRAYDFVLDGTHFGRGESYISDYEQVKHQYSVVDLKKWKVSENKNSLEDATNDTTEHFYSSDCYVIYAKYKVTTTDLKSGTIVEKDSAAENTKEIYFYWRGWLASKGYSPLPEELNIEDVPVDRTYQWTESPIFLRLFHGSLVVHNKSNLSAAARLYMLCGTVKEEAHFVEVPKKKKSLRSRTSFLLVLPHDHQLFIWYGSKAYNRDFFDNVLLSLQTKASIIYGTDNKSFNVTKVEEKNGDEKFLSYLNGSVNDYFTLANEVLLKYEYNPRLFYLNNITGEFTAIEIEYTLGSDYLNPFPFLQDHLYTAAQPALFLLDNDQELWLWQGWKNEAITEGQLLEFEKQRECAIETARLYWREKHPSLKENIYLVAAGIEPLQFTNLFPFWISKDGLRNHVIQFSENNKYDFVSTKFFV